MDKVVSITSYFLGRLLIMLAIPVVSDNSNCRSKFGKYPEYHFKKMTNESNRMEIIIW